MTTEQLSAKEIEFRDALIRKTSSRIMNYLENRGNPFQTRLLLYLVTPKLCFYSMNVIPVFFNFSVKHGDINWKEDFPFLLRDQEVNLVKICRSAVEGNLTYFPAHWTAEMIFDFVKECVDTAVHEFSYCW